MTRLRKMMLEELQRRNYSAITTRNYLRVVTEFAKYFGKSPDKLGANELRTYQAYLLTECKLTPGTVVNRVAALRFFFVKTLKRHQFREFLPYPRDRRRLPTVLSREEVARLINAAETLFRRTLLMTLYATGMRRSELAHRFRSSRLALSRQLLSSRSSTLVEAGTCQASAESSSVWHCPRCGAAMIVMQRFTAAELSTCSYFDSSYRVHHWRPRDVLPHAGALVCPPPRHRLSGHSPHTLWRIFNTIPTIPAAFPPRFAALPEPVQIHAAIQIP